MAPYLLTITYVSKRRLIKLTKNSKADQKARQRILPNIEIDMKHKTLIPRDIPTSHLGILQKPGRQPVPPTGD